MPTTFFATAALVALDAFIHRMERNNGIASQVLNNREMLAAVMSVMMREVHGRAREQRD